MPCAGVVLRMGKVSETQMTKRRINLFFFAAAYLAFLAWYDGWGQSPMTPGEVEGYLANFPEDAEGVEFLDRLRQMGADDDGEEFFMLNLNRYEYAEGEPNVGVPSAYQEYGAEVVPMILSNAGHPVYSGTFFADPPKGDSNEAHWNEVILVRYRSRRDFIRMVTSDDYLEAARHRAGGIAYAEVSPTSARMTLTSPRLIVFLLLLVPALLLDYVLKRSQP